MVPLGVPLDPPPLDVDAEKKAASEAGAAGEDEGGEGKRGKKGKSDATDTRPSMGHKEAEKVLHSKIAKRHDPMSVQKADWGMVHPLSPFMKYWDIVTLFLLLYTATLTPYEVAFLKDRPLSAMYFVNLVVNFAFFFDLCLNFNLMYFSDKQMKMVTRRRDVAVNYLRGFFIIDFISILPYDDISTATGGGGGNLKILRVVRIFRLAKLLRILRSSRIFARFENSMTINYGALKLFKFIVGTLFIAHWMACLWHLIKVIEASKCNWVYEYYHGACSDSTVEVPKGGFDMNPIGMYVTALYLSVMTISTVGYGDVTPQTDAERTYLIFAMLIGASVYAYVVGSICSIIASMNMRETEFQEQMDALNTFIHEARIEKHLALRLRAYFRYKRHSTSFKSWHALLANMSPTMRGDVAIQLNKGWMSGITYFEGIPQAVAIELSFTFVLETYPPSENIINEDDESNALFVIKQGVVICRGVVKTTNGVFGEDMLWRTRQRGYRAQSLSFVDTYSLSSSELERVLKEYPSVAKMFRRIAVRKIVCEKIIEAARIVKEYCRFLADWYDASNSVSPTMASSMDFMNEVIGERVYVSVPARLQLIRVANAEYFDTLDKHAAFLQRIFRGHQARKYFRLRKEAKEKGVPVALLNVKSVKESMNTGKPSKKPNPLQALSSVSQKQMMLPQLSTELLQLKDELMASMHELLKETIREELKARGA